MITRKTRSHYIDQDGNKWTKKRFSFSEAQSMAASLSGCENCTDCKDCHGCITCADCTSCRECFGCAGCKDCVWCFDCKGCTGCIDCCDCTNENGAERLKKTAYTHGADGTVVIVQ